MNSKAIELVKQRAKYLKDKSIKIESVSSELPEVRGLYASISNEIDFLEQLTIALGGKLS